MSIEWFNPQQIQAIATIAPNHITLNTVVIPYFENVYRVRLGYDALDSVILIKLLNKDEAFDPRINKAELINYHLHSSYVRVNSTSFIDFLKEKGELQNILPQKYHTQYDENKRTISIFLKNKEGAQ